MTPLVPIALFGWIPLVLLLFAVMRPRRAVLVGMIGGWLFLPMAQYPLPGLPDYGKVTAVSASVLLGTLLFDSQRLMRFRLRWMDLPVVAWCLAPFASSVSNGLGVYDGVSAALAQTVLWGAPYLVGRLYFADWEGLRELAVGIFVGGLIYAPLCLYEIRFSPQLHRIFYGYHQHTFSQTMRFGGFRPMVFMQHGLMVGMWMTTASLAGLWLAMTGAMKRIEGISVWWWVGALLVVTVWCKSAFAVGLLVVGVGVLASVKWRQWQLPLAALVVLAPIYMVARQMEVVGKDRLVWLAGQVTNEDRASSLEVRLEQERVFSERAWQRPVFGWGGWRRSFPVVDAGQASRAVDSQWIIAFGTNGLVGLAALTVALLLPAAIFLRRVPTAVWGHPTVAPMTALVLLQTLYMIDNLLNAMVNPILLVSLGGVSGLLGLLRRRMFTAPAATRIGQPQSAQAGF